MTIARQADPMPRKAQQQSDLPFLQGQDGERIPLSVKLYQQIRDLVLSSPSSDCEQVTPAEQTQRLTTGQAAQILGISQRTLTRMLDRGLIPYSRPQAQGYRFLNLEDVLAYKRQRDQQTRHSLENMRENASQAGSYDVDYSQYLAQFKD
ncbi:hypothetical protein KIMH_04840 [Bombiscardovia apis]|uniref:Helix-turn-helix domain-containing protein n=1 Tax=Bombiscardovia apis TaxID=2932182 RepID=A0ABM8BBU7_9BIFI|nr:helix-turn-helix domain-containing protein [Bombiscardovia apis]BDR54373.1 hypothetical protein KIMH_04840 [Bombiscardovia apis]